METHYINNLDFAKRQQVLKSDILPSSLVRLNAMLAKEDGDVDRSKISFQLTGQSQQHQLPSLHLDIEANLSMICQRCLESMLVSVALHFDYIVTADELALDDNDEVDWVEQSDAMDVHALIEDELLIALPIAPVHSPMCKQLNLESGEKPNPFSVLKALKKDGN